MGNVWVKENQSLQSNSLKSKVDDESVSVEVSKSFEELGLMQREWDDFVESAVGEIFLTYDWCRIWWKYYGKNRHLRIFIFRSNKELVGIIPLFYEKIWLGPIPVRAVKIVGSDFTLSQFSLPVDRGYMKGIMRKFFELLAEDKWDILHIGPIASLYKDYHELKSACKELFGHSYLVLGKNNGVQTYFKLTDTWDEYLAALNQKERTKIRRSYRLACKAAGDKTASVIATRATMDNFEKIFSGFVQMHQEHWQRLRRLGHFGDWHSAQEFHRELAEVQVKRGRLRLIQIKLGDWCLGYKYGYILGNNYFDYLDARSDRKVLTNVGLGRIIYSEVIKKAIQGKAKWIDSNRGKYRHKLEIGGELFPIRNLFIIPKKKLTVLRVGLFRLFAHLLNLLYYRIWYNKIAPKLLFKRKGLWKMWIRTCGLA